MAQGWCRQNNRLLGDVEQRLEVLGLGIVRLSHQAGLSGALGPGVGVFLETSVGTEGRGSARPRFR